jgi:hypothetical protein
MWLALLRKELTETVPLGLCAWAFLLTWVGLETQVGILTMFPFWGWFGIHPKEISSIPFLDTKMHTPLAIAAGFLGAVLAGRQIFFEEQSKAYGFLLPLPVKRSTLFLIKMLVGMVVYFIALLIPVLVYALWAATPGTHPSPFYWSMTWLPIKLAIALTVLYFGWMLTWLRPVKWYGTRLLPLVAVIALAFMWAELMDWLWWGVLLVILTDALLAVSILWVAETRDY